jgi:hypothetical protein
VENFTVVLVTQKRKNKNKMKLVSKYCKGIFIFVVLMFVSGVVRNTFVIPKNNDYSQNRSESSLQVEQLPLGNQCGSDGRPY